jgi:hypothetical protein
VDPVADLHHERHVVVDQQHAGVEVLRDRADDLGELTHLRLRDPRPGLVEKHERRRRRDRTRDAEQALVSVRQLPRGRVLLKAEPRDQLARAGASLGRPGAGPERRDLDVLAHGQAAERTAVLERPADPGARTSVRAPAGDVAAAELDRARRRGVEPGEQVHERRLAGAVRPDQPDDLVPVQLERDAVERLHARERPRHRGGPERFPGPPRRSCCRFFRQGLDLRDDLGGNGADVARLVVLDLDHAVLAPEDAVELR